MDSSRDHARDTVDVDVLASLDELPAETVPMWLAALALVLLMAVFGVGGYLLRGYVADRDAEPSTGSLVVDELEEKVEEDPRDIASRLDLAFALQARGDLDEARSQYEAVLDIDSRNTSAIYGIGVILLEQEKPKEAEEKLWDVLEVSPEHAMAAKALGELYADRGQYKSLLVAVKPAAEAHESLADLQYLMGLGYEKTGDASRAREYFQLALKYDSDLSQAREGLARLGAE